MTSSENYTSHGAKLLQDYVSKHPENVVWNERDGWHDDADPKGETDR